MMRTPANLKFTSHYVTYEVIFSQRTSTPKVILNPGVVNAWKVQAPPAARLRLPIFTGNAMGHM